MAAEAAVLARIAPAKVNLYLHLCGRRPDGYHLLDSLVVFPAIGDRVEARPARGLSLSVDGPFAAGLPDGADNLVLRAARALAEASGVSPGAALRLTKVLPVASGIGGGSSDAAAALDLLSSHWRVAVPDGLALSLGADVPVCRLAPRPARMQGIGERLSPGPRLPRFWLVLVNPGLAVPTGAVFSGISEPSPPPGPPVPEPGFGDFAGFAGWLAAQRNDLEAPAAAICPEIGRVLQALSGAPIARMSGSGATCFAIVETEAEADAMAERLRPSGWWVAMAPVDPAEPEASAAPRDVQTGA